MLDAETFRTALDTLKAQGWRSSLTVIGIVLGITAIIALVSLGEGLNASVSQQFESLGNNTLIVLPGKSFADSAFIKLQAKDADHIEALRGIDFAAEIFILPKQVEFKGEKKTVLLIGLEADKMEKLSVAGIGAVEEGKQLFEKDQTGLVAGPDLAQTRFRQAVQVNNSVLIGDQRFKVIGIAEKSSNNFFGSFFNNAMVMNARALENVAGESISPSRILVRLLPGVDPEQTKRRITAVLEKTHNREDFQVLSPQQVGQTATGILDIVQLVLVGIAAISLIVGAVGIMNTMFMSVTERTNEVGLMKAIGATNQQVLAIFLAEALWIGLIGGIIGILLGTGLAQLISLVAGLAGFELQAVVSLPLIGFALLFALIVGLASGVWPAKTAADLDPVEALRQKE